MAVGDIFSLQMQCSLDARKVTNVFGYEQTGGQDFANLPELLIFSWIDKHLDQFRALMSDDVRLQCMYCTGVDPGKHLPHEFPFDNVIGSASSNAVPANVAWVLSFVTDSNSSADNGRHFYYGVSDDNTEDSLISGAFGAGPVNAYASSITTELAWPTDPNVTWQLGVIDRVFNGMPLVVPLINTVVQSAARGPLFTQRRRGTRRTSIAPAETPGP